MERKRSKGVTILGIYLIASNIMTLLTLQFNKGIVGDSWTGLYIVFSSVIMIFLVINLLRLKEWARKFIVYYVGISLVVAMFLNPIYLKRMHSHAVSKGIKSVDSKPFSTATVNVIHALFAGAIVYFLSRPKVKEQFVLTTKNG